MIARRLGMRQKKSSDIVRLVEYITSTQSKNHRVGDVFITNCMNDDPEMAAREMLTKQLLNARSKADKTYHLLVSFKYGEQPTEQILRKVEAALCAKLGFTQHQRIAVVHRDTDHVHMHIAINKVHPKKLTVKTPFRDFRVLGEACAEIEQKLFLQQDNHTPTGKTRGERLAGDIEARTGNESLHTWIHREVLPNLRKADSWETLHRELAKAGLSLALRGAGIVVTSRSGHKITGSNIDRSFSKFHLEKRLGAFQKRPEWCDDIKPDKGYLRNANAPATPLREEYEKWRDAGDEAKDTRLAAIATEYTRKKEAILAENVFDKARAHNTSMGRYAKRKLYDAIHKKFRGQMASLNADAKRVKQEVFAEFSSRSWAAWLQEQARAGRQEAVDALRKRAFSLARSGGAALRGEKEIESGPALDQKIDGVTKHGAVIYDMGNDSVRDDRDSFRISAGAAPETDIIALTLAKRRFGNVIHVDGDRAFRERMVRATVNGNVYVKFGDPEMERQRNQLYRQQYQQKKSQHRPDDGPGRDGQNTMTATAENSIQEKPDTQWFNKRTANQFAQQLGDGSSPLQRRETQNLPYNPATGRPYHGINALSLMMQGRKDDRWLTWDEAKQNGLSIIKGEKPTPIQYWPKKRHAGELNRAITTWLYNGEQLSGMPPMPHKPERPDPMNRVLDILKNSGATIVYDREHRGYYSAKKDEIHLPNPDKVGKEQFCEDALNQYFKSTGHPSRLNRDTFNAFTGYKQSKEELACGVATAMMCAELGVPPQPARNADLVEGWREYMTDKPVDFARDIGAVDKAVWTTLQHEYARNKTLNPLESEVWRPIPEEFPHGAVKTFLDRKEVLDKIENSPDKLDRFSHEGREIFALPESGYLLDKKEHVPDDPAAGCTLLLKTQGFDRLGNAHAITVQYDVKLDENGLSHRPTPPQTNKITETHKNMMLPRDWSGALRMAGCSEDAQGNRVINEQAPDFYTIFAKRDNGQEVGIAEFSSRRDGEKYIYQVNRQYEYQAERRGIEADFAKMRNPDCGFSPPAQEQGSAKAVNREGSRSEPAQDMDRTTPQIEPTEQTRAECIAAMESVGMIVTGDHPIFDGKGHRIDVEGDRPGQNTGWYVAHADGRPSGACMNNRTKDKVNWTKSQGYELDDAKRSELREIAKAKKETTEKTTAASHQKAVKRIAWMMEKVFTKPSEPTPYLAQKGLPLDPGIYQNQRSTCIPIHDAKGNVHSMAYVKEDGAKNYAKESNKNGHFYAYGGIDALRKAPAIIICEGYATAASISMATGQPTIAAFDSGNLPSVAETLHELFPGKPIIVAGDNDRHLDAQGLTNTGELHAQRAANAVNGKMVLPRWDEKTPADKQHTDFDDLRRIQGIEAVRSQLTPVIEREVERAKQHQSQQAEQEKTRGSLTRS